MLGVPGRRKSREVLALPDRLPFAVALRRAFTGGYDREAFGADLQLKDVLGLHMARMPERFPQKVAAMWAARGTAALPELGVAAATLTLLVLAPRLTRRVPGPLVAIGAVALAVWALGVPVDTLGTRFHTTIGGHEIAGIPPLPPTPGLPWGDGPLTFRLIQKLLPSAFAIAMLGAIESLLSAVVADGMTGKRHD